MKILLHVGIVLFPLSVVAGEASVLPHTQPLTWTGDLSAQMHEAAHREIESRIADSIQSRPRFWQRDLSSSEAYERSIQANRQRFGRSLGLIDPRRRAAMERFGDDENPVLAGETRFFRAYQVRWPVLEGVSGEGLLLEPKEKMLGFVVAVPDADQTPEQIAGLAPGVSPESQFARRLAENGFTVVVPMLIDRSTRDSGNSEIRMTNQPHREWIHRQAYMMGRHLIGYEVHKVLAAVDWFESRRSAVPALQSAKIGVAGYGEGGLIALYAAATDPRIQAAWSSGYFRSRQRTWEEPLYRNVWGLLREFGDGEIATLIAPRGLVVEYSEEPRGVLYPPLEPGKNGLPAPGKLETPPFQEVQQEFDRIGTLIPSGLQSRHLAHGANGAPLPAGSQGSLVEFARLLGVTVPMALSPELSADRRRSLDLAARQSRQVKELEHHVQALVNNSDATRTKFFARITPDFRKAPRTPDGLFGPLSPEAFIQGAKEYKAVFWEEIIGKLDDPLPPMNPRTRKIYDQPAWTGYDVVLDVGRGAFAWGVLCVPKNIRPGEKRPVVVCQHGRNGLPQNVIEGDVPAYHDYAARLAERGFVTFAPHNLYRSEHIYRMLSRKGHTIKASMYSLILRHHEQILNWIETLPYVDAKRIAFYGLSYGGATAVRAPALLERYCLSISSGDFNDSTRKVASTQYRQSFMFTDEWEVSYFNMGGTFSHAELTYLILPRPFMVERGHRDGVGVDHWVASEYAKTRWLYTQFGLADKTEIEYFNSGHTIHGKGTFAFLHKHLNWPAPR